MAMYVQKILFQSSPSLPVQLFHSFTTSSAWRKWFKDVVNKKRSGDLKGKYLAFLYYKNVIVCSAESTSSMTKWPYDKISMINQVQFTKNIKDYIQRHFRYCWCHSHWWARAQDLGDIIISKETFQVPVNLLCSLHSAAPLLSPTLSLHLLVVSGVTLRRETPHGIVCQSHGDWRTASEIQDLGLAWDLFLLFLFAMSIIC